MSTKKPQNYTMEFKAKVALEAIKGDSTLNEISKKYGLHATQINRWKQQALAGIKTNFKGKQQKAELDHQNLIDNLYRQIGQLTCENEFLKKSLWK